MKKKNTIKKTLISGLLILPIFFSLTFYFLKKWNLFELSDYKIFIISLYVSLMVVLIINTEFLNQPSEELAMIGKEKAMYPEIPEVLLHDKPSGIMLGRDKKTGAYVCKELNEDGHVFLIGGSGSGKSSAFVIPTLLLNKETRVFAVDIKGELSFKSAKYGSEHVRIFAPSDRSKFGYNPLYNLTDNSNTQQIMETMQNISYSLISLPADIKDPFWKTSARNLLTGLLVYYYKQGTREFISIIDEILQRPVKESIQAVMDNAKPASVEYRYIVQFKDLEDETLGDIVSEMNNHIVVFSNDQDIRYAFLSNPNRVNPLNLEEGYSIYLSIREEKLSYYYDVMQLIINQTLAQLERRPEDSEPIIFVIDELPRILSAGKLDRLLDGARTLRSRKVCLFLITQSTEALMKAYTENEVADLIANCPYIIVLSASSQKTQKSVCSWCGKYKVRKTSWSDSGRKGKLNVSYDEKDIVDPSDLLTLKNTGEAILINPYGYSRVKKVPYYEDKILKPMSEEIIKYNKTISTM